MVEISKKDWKLFREKVPDWQEHYMEGLIKGNYSEPPLFKDEIRMT